MYKSGGTTKYLAKALNSRAGSLRCKGINRVQCYRGCLVQSRQWRSKFNALCLMSALSQTYTDKSKSQWRSKFNALSSMSALSETYTDKSKRQWRSKFNVLCPMSALSQTYTH